MTKKINPGTFGKGRVFEVFADLANKNPEYRKYFARISFFSTHLANLKYIPTVKERRALARILLAYYKDIDQVEEPKSYVNNIYHALYRKFLRENA